MHDIGRQLDRAARRGLIHQTALSGLGLTGSGITNLVDRGLLTRLHLGVYRVAGGERGWEPDVLAATLAAGAEAVASHRAAARLWGLTDGITPIELAVPYTESPEPARAVVHRSTDLTARYVTVRRGVPVTKPARTLLDLGKVVDRAVVAEAVERALVTKLVSVRGLIVVLEELGRRGRGGTAALRYVLEHRPLGRQRSESVLESFFARLAMEFGLDQVAYQHEITVDGRLRYVDFAILDALLGVELDGEGVHAVEQGRASDRARDRAFAAIGWQIVRVGWTDLSRRPVKTMRELATIAAERRRLLAAAA